MKGPFEFALDLSNLSLDLNSGMLDYYGSPLGFGRSRRLTNVTAGSRRLCPQNYHSNQIRYNTLRATGAESNP